MSKRGKKLNAQLSIAGNDFADVNEAKIITSILCLTIAFQAAILCDEADFVLHR